MPEGRQEESKPLCRVLFLCSPFEKSNFVSKIDFMGVFGEELLTFGEAFEKSFLRKRWRKSKCFSKD